MDLEESQREEGARDFDLLAPGEVAVAEEGGSKVEAEGQIRRREVGAAAVWVEHGDVQALLAVGQVEGAEAFEEGAIGGGALHEQVLAVIDLVAGVFIEEGVGGAPGPGAAFQHLDLVATVGELQPGGQSGQARADDADPHGRAGVSPIAPAPGGRRNPRGAR